MGAADQYLQGVYAPVMEELEVADLSVHGELPEGFAGMFVQNGANPRFAPNVGHSWFDGDGMVQGVHVEDGRVSFRSRFIRTAGLAEDLAADAATYVGSLSKPGLGRRHKNVANTDLVWHDGRLLALWWEGGQPHELSIPNLETIGTWDAHGTLTTGLTSHAKLDPATDELFFISWSPRPPFLHACVSGPDGRVRRVSPVELPGPRVQHDMAISDRWICVFDFPLNFDFQRDGDEFGFVLDDERPARIGLLDRHHDGAPVRWFEVDPCFMWHLSSAWDEEDAFVLVGARIEGATRKDKRGGIHDDLPLVDGEHRFDSHPWMWRLNTRDGSVQERQLDDAFVEFPRVNDANICSGARYSYMAEIDTRAQTLQCHGLIKYDLRNDHRERFALPEHHICYEHSFAPRTSASVEDDGFLVGFVTDMNRLTSEFWITPAQALEDGPVARIALPQRVPPKFHGRWLPAHVLR